MLENKCPKCNKIFTTHASMIKHISRSIDCEKMKCIRCNKLFKTKQEFTKHKNRKIPCKIMEDTTIDTKLEIQLHIIKEKTKQKQTIKCAKIDIMEKKKNNTILILNKKQEIELIKCDRKNRTAKIINIENLNINTQNIINNLSEKYIPDNIRTATKEDMSDTIQDIIEKFNTKRAITIYNNYNTFRDITSMVLRFYFNNNANKHLRSIFYQKTLDKFFAILVNTQNDKEIKEIDFDTYLYPIIKNLLDPLYDILLSANPKPKPYDFIKNYEFIVIKHEDMIATKNYIHKNQDVMKKYSTRIFDEDNSLDLPSEYFFNELSSKVLNNV